MFHSCGGHEWWWSWSQSMQFPTEGRSSGLRNLSSAKPLLFVHQNVQFWCTKIQWNPLCHYRLCYSEKKILNHPIQPALTSKARLSNSFNASHCPVPWLIPKELKFEAFFTAWFAAQKLMTFSWSIMDCLPLLSVGTSILLRKKGPKKCGNHETIHFIGALFVFFSKARLEIKTSEVWSWFCWWWAYQHVVDKKT